MTTNRLTADGARVLSARMREIIASVTPGTYPPVEGERYVIGGEDGHADGPWYPREACEACGMVDAQTDQQDDNGDAWRMCQECQDNNDDMMGGN